MAYERFTFWEKLMTTSIERLKGQFIQEKQDKKPKPKRDTNGTVQGSIHRNSRHVGAYGEY